MYKYLKDTRSLQIPFQELVDVLVGGTGSIDGDDVAGGIQEHEARDAVDVVKLTEVLAQELFPLRLVLFQFR